MSQKQHKASGARPANLIPRPTASTATWQIQWHDPTTTVHLYC